MARAFRKAWYQKSLVGISAKQENHRSACSEMAGNAAWRKHSTSLSARQYQSIILNGSVKNRRRAGASISGSRKMSTCAAPNISIGNVPNTCQWYHNYSVLAIAVRNARRPGQYRGNCLAKKVLAGAYSTKNAVMVIPIEMSGILGEVNGEIKLSGIINFWRSLKSIKPSP